MDRNRSSSTDVRLADLRVALLDLAYDVHSYLRRHARAAVRVSAALLIATSLAACGPSSAVPGVAYAPVQPLASDVRLGLPGQPGRYAIVPGSLGRDAQGVYHFAWRRPGDPATAQNYASASLLQVAQGGASELLIPTQGNPTLFLPADAAIPLVGSASDLRTPIPGGTGGGYYPLWRPFYGGYRGPGYYDLPTETQVVSPGDVVNGSRVSTSPSPPSSRVVGLARAVSGRAGGSGSGVAATNKSGAPVVSSHGGAAAAKSGGFSAGVAGGGGGGGSS